MEPPPIHQDFEPAAYSGQLASSNRSSLSDDKTASIFQSEENDESKHDYDNQNEPALLDRCDSPHLNRDSPIGVDDDEIRKFLAGLAESDNTSRGSQTPKESASMETEGNDIAKSLDDQIEEEFEHRESISTLINEDEIAEIAVSPVDMKPSTLYDQPITLHSPDYDNFESQPHDDDLLVETPQQSQIEMEPVAGDISYFFDEEEGIGNSPELTLFEAEDNDTSDDESSLLGDVIKSDGHSISIKSATVRQEGEQSGDREGDYNEDEIDLSSPRGETLVPADAKSDIDEPKATTTPPLSPCYSSSSAETTTAATSTTKIALSPSSEASSSFLEQTGLNGDDNECIVPTAPSSDVEQQSENEEILEIDSHSGVANEQSRISPVENVNSSTYAYDEVEIQSDNVSAPQGVLAMTSGNDDEDFERETGKEDSEVITVTTVIRKTNEYSPFTSESLESDSRQQRQQLQDLEIRLSALKDLLPVQEKSGDETLCKDYEKTAVLGTETSPKSINKLPSVIPPLAASILPIAQNQSTSEKLPAAVPEPPLPQFSADTESCLLRQKVLEQAKLLSQLSSHIEKVRNDNKALDQRYHSLQDSSSLCAKELERLRETSINMETEVAIKVEMCETLKQELEKQKALEEQLINELEIQSEFGTANVEVASLQERENQLLREKIDKQEEIIDSLKLEIGQEHCTTQNLNAELEKFKLATNSIDLELSTLRQLVQDKEKYEGEIATKSEQCKQLEQELDENKKLCNLLENEIRESNDQKRELNIQNIQLQSLQVESMSKVTDECFQLKLHISELEGDYVSAKSDVATLQSRVRQLEDLIKTLTNAAEERKRLEREYQSGLEQLRQRQQELDSVSKHQNQLTREHEETVDQLQGKLRELDKRCELQAIKHDELLLELGNLKYLQEKARLNDQLSFPENLDSLVSAFQSPAAAPSGGGGVTAMSLGQQRGYRLARTDPLHNSPRRRFETSKSTDTGDWPSDPAGKLAAINRGSIRVFIARYSYDPLLLSPNENPELELNVQAGDYIFIYGNMDEDGFYEGELMDGRRGLVPSNFIQPLNTIELADFKTALSAAATLSASSAQQQPQPQALLVSSTPRSATGAAQGTVDNSSTATGMQDLSLLRSSAAGATAAFDPSSSSLPVLNCLSTSEDGQMVTSDRYASSNHIGSTPSRFVPRSSAMSPPTFGMGVEDEADAAPPMVEHINISQDATAKLDIPHPRNLRIEKILTSSVLVAWDPPLLPQSASSEAPIEVQSYLILVNGELKATVGYSERTKCLVEGLNTRKFHRLSVRSNTARGQSRDPQCTLTFGRGATLAPQSLKASSVSASSAALAWCPSNSNCHHMIYVNNVEHCVVDQGVFRYTLSGLLPSMTYRVSVKAKDLTQGSLGVGVGHFPTSTAQSSSLASGRSTPGACNTIDLSSRRSNRCSSADVNVAQIVFKTLPGGLPETTQNVQIENGPREGSILVSWQPVNISTTGTSNGALITGYAIYADGNRRVAEVPSPTADHILLSWQQLATRPSEIPSFVTVRTLSAGEESVDSMPAPLGHVTEELQRLCGQAVANGALAAVAPKMEQPALLKPQPTYPSTHATLSLGAQGSSPAMGPQPVSSLPSSMQHYNASSLSLNAGATATSSASMPKVPLFSTTPSSSHSQQPALIQSGISGTSGFSSPKISTNITSGSSTLPIPAHHRDGSLLADRRSASLSDDYGPGAQPMQKSMSDHKPGEQPLNLATPNKPRTAAPTAFSVAQDTGQPVALTTKPGPPPPSTTTRSRPETVPSDAVPFGPPPAHGATSTAMSKTTGAAVYASPWGQRPIGAFLRPPYYSSFYHRFPGDPYGVLHGMRSLRPGMMRNNSVEALEYNPESGGYEIPGIDNIPMPKTRSSEYLNESGPRMGFMPRGPMPYRGRLPFRVPSIDPMDPYLRSPNAGDPYWMRSPGSAYFPSPRGPSGPPSAAMIQVPRLPPGFKPKPGALPPGIRTFIALYDYDPTTMSPNPDAGETELPLKEGQLIKVYGERDRDGFYRGEGCGRAGLLPSNMIQEVSVTDQLAVDSLFDPNNKREVFYRSGTSAPPGVGGPPGMLGMSNMLTTTQPSSTVPQQSLLQPVIGQSRPPVNDGRRKSSSVSEGLSSIRQRPPMLFRRQNTYEEDVFVSSDKPAGTVPSSQFGLPSINTTIAALSGMHLPPPISSQQNQRMQAPAKPLHQQQQQQGGIGGGIKSFLGIGGPTTTTTTATSTTLPGSVTSTIMSTTAIPGPLAGQRPPTTSLLGPGPEMGQGFLGQNRMPTPGSMAQQQQQPRMPQPGQPGMMNQPGQQGMMNQPGQPGMMNQPGQPGMMNQPGQQGMMNQPGQPGMMNQPGQPGMMSQPGQPGMMSQPGQPGMMSQPGQPGMMNQPGMANQPGQPGMMNQPGQPGMMNQPGQPGQIRAGMGPQQPGMPISTLPGMPASSMMPTTATGQISQVTTTATTASAGLTGQPAAGNQRPFKYVQAVYDYDPRSSPNPDAAELELGFKVGDVLGVLQDVDEDGFYFALFNGRQGLVPSNFVKDTTPPPGATLAPHPSTLPKTSIASTMGPLGTTMTGATTMAGATNAMGTTMASTTLPGATTMSATMTTPGMTAATPRPGAPGTMPGGMSAGMAGGMPGSMPGAMSGGMPGGMSGAMGGPGMRPSMGMGAGGMRPPPNPLAGSMNPLGMGGMRPRGGPPPVIRPAPMGPGGGGIPGFGAGRGGGAPSFGGGPGQQGGQGLISNITSVTNNLTTGLQEKAGGILGGAGGKAAQAVNDCKQQ